MLYMIANRDHSLCMSTNIIENYTSYTIYVSHKHLKNLKVSVRRNLCPLYYGMGILAFEPFLLVEGGFVWANIET